MRAIEVLQRESSIPPVARIDAQLNDRKWQLHHLQPSAEAAGYCVCDEIAEAIALRTFVVISATRLSSSR